MAHLELTTISPASIQVIEIVPEEMMLRTLAHLYLEQYSRVHKSVRSFKEDRQRLRYLAPLMERPINSISRKEVEALHTYIGQRTKTTANKTIEQLRAMLNWAIDQEHLPPHHRNPVRKIKMFKLYPSVEFVTIDKMPLLFKVLNQYPDKQASDVIKVALLTGLRFNEVVSLTWDEVNLKNRTIMLKGQRTKNGLPHSLPVVNALFKILSSIEQRNEFVFPGRFKDTRRYHVDAQWRKIRVLACIPKVRFHDLRRTVGSWLIQQTGSLALVGEVLNQTNKHITKIYSLYDRREVTKQLHTYSQKLEELGLFPDFEVSPDLPEEEIKIEKVLEKVIVKKSLTSNWIAMVPLAELKGLKTSESGSLEARLSCKLLYEKKCQVLYGKCPHAIRVFLEQANNADNWETLKSLAQEGEQLERIESQESNETMLSEGMILVHKRKDTTNPSQVNCSALFDIQWSRYHRQWRLAATIKCIDTGWKHNKRQTPCPHLLDIVIYPENNDTGIIDTLTKIADERNDSKW